MTGINMPDLMYLLGMITGKGSIIPHETETTINISIPHKLLRINGQDAEGSVQIALNTIRNRIQPLVEVTSLQARSNRTETNITFSKPNTGYLMRQINEYFNLEQHWRDFRIPNEIFDSTRDMQREFMRGLADVTGHIRSSNMYFKDYDNRVYIEIPTNWYLVIDICNILKRLNIPVHTIDWGHPNIRDSKLREFRAGRDGAFREHQIKIFAEEFERIGFTIPHKQNMLVRLSNENRRRWRLYWQRKSEITTNIEKRTQYIRKIEQLQESHHRFYWDTNNKSRLKPDHPQENDIRIHEDIRGRHFNSWREIADTLGYRRDDQ